MKPLVSVIFITYNHENYIRQALEGVVSQEINFSAELLIHDDASTDKTADIIKRYVSEAKNSKITVKPIYEKENQYSKGTYEFINDMFRAAKGKYIAVCEGDDYWTDPTKLQRQADFLDSHPDYALCFHPVKVTHENQQAEDYVYPGPRQKPFTVERLLERNFIQTNSVMYRRHNYTNVASGIIPSDWYMHLYHAQYGKIGFIDRKMAVYRKHPGGVWWEAHRNRGVIWQKYGIKHLGVFVEFLKLYSKDAKKRTIIYGSISSMMDNLVDSDAAHQGGLVKKALETYPDNAEDFVKSQRQAIKELESDNKRAKSELDKYKAALKEKQIVLAERDQQIKQLRSSKVVKLWLRLTRQKGI